MVVVDATEHDQFLLELVDRGGHHRVDVLVGQGVGPGGAQALDAPQPTELVVDGGAGAGQLVAFDLKVDRRARVGGGAGVHRAEQCTGAAPTGREDYPIGDYSTRSVSRGPKMQKVSGVQVPSQVQASIWAGLRRPVAPRSSS